MSKLQKEDKTLYPYIGVDLNGDGVVDTVPVQLVGPDGLPISTTSHKVDVRASEIESKQDTLASLVATAAKQQEIIDKLTVGLTLSGSKAEIASAQDSNLATVVEAYTRAVGATQMEVYVESGSIRVRTDGVACTATTGEPLGAGFYGKWAVASISIYNVAASTYTVVSR